MTVLALTREVDRGRVLETAAPLTIRVVVRVSLDQLMETHDGELHRPFHGFAMRSRWTKAKFLRCMLEPEGIK